MQWEPQKPAGQRTKLAVVAIAAIPIILVVVGILVLAWQLLGSSTAQERVRPAGPRRRAGSCRP
jgi:flagellar basal body-associated protein FliL